MMIKRFLWGFIISLAVFGKITTEESVIRNQSIVSDPNNQRPVLDPGLKINQDGMAVGSDGVMVWILYSANKMTPGYKRVKPYTILENGTPRVEAYPLHVPGPPIASNRDLDVYIQNPQGYFLVEAKSGTRFLMRDGRFKKEPESKYLITVSGQNRVLSEDLKPIELPNADLYITHSGEIIANGESIATLRIVSVSDTNQLNIIDGMRMYTDPDYIVAMPLNKRFIQQGFYEGSAVPKALRPDTRGIYQRIYLYSSHSAKRGVRMMRNSIRLNQ